VLEFGVLLQACAGTLTQDGDHDAPRGRPERCDPEPALDGQDIAKVRRPGGGSDSE
jgi:hypothetical protein